MFVASAITCAVNLFSKAPDLTTFVERAQLKLVLRMLLPTAVFVVMIGYLGIYVSTALFIGFFMWRLGGDSVTRILPVTLLVPIASFFRFEILFLVTLPEGPLGTALG